MNNKRNSKIILYLVIGLVAIWLLYTISWSVVSGVKLSKSFSNVEINKKELANDYKSIFKPGVLETLNILMIKSIGHRNDIAILKYGSNYDITLYKIATIKDTSLLNIIHYSLRKVKQTPNEVYNIISAPQYYFSCLDNEKNMTKELFVGVQGDSLQVINRNDSLITLFIKAQSFSISYANGVNDIVISTEGNLFTAPMIPMSIAFIKNENELYLMVITGENLNIISSKALLNKIVGNVSKQLVNT